MDYAIGTRIELINAEHGDMTVEVVKGDDGCHGCAFKIKYNGCNRSDYHLDPTSCSKIFRRDKNNIIFKQIK